MTLTDAVALLVIAALTISLGLRLFKGEWRSTSKALLVSQTLVLILFVISLSWTYPALDRAMGQRNYLNLGMHLVYVAASWIYTTVVAAPLAAAGRRPVVLRPWVPVVAAAGVTSTFFLMGADSTTSRGLEDFVGGPAWTGYLLSTHMCLWVPAFSLVPWLLNLLKSTPLRGLRFTYCALLVGYGGSVAAMGGYVLSSFVPHTIVVRESLILLTAMGIILALISISVSSHQQAAQYRARQQAQAEAARSFQH